MSSLEEEIQTFPRSRLRKQRVRVTTLTGRRIIETWKGSILSQEEEPNPPECIMGYVPDNSWDLHIGLIKPFLLLGSQDAAHDFETLRKHKVSHILNVAYGVDNLFPELFIYRSIRILEEPDAELSLHLEACCAFIREAMQEKGVVLVHCNTGVSRAVAVVIGFLMSCDGRSFEEAFSLVKAARPNSCPNPGFLEQLRKYRAPQKTGSH